MKVVRMADADVAEGRIPFSCAEVGEYSTREIKGSV